MEHRATPDRRAVPVAWAGFLLLGWSGVLVPSLVREVEARFGVDDAALGLFYLATSLAYGLSSFAGGVLTERVGRRVVLGTAAIILVGGLALEGTVPSWAGFLVAGPLVGLGSGALDGGMNALILDAVDAGRARALNLLHLCFSIGAFGSPIVVGRLVSVGLDWQVVILGTVLGAVPVALALWLVRMPSGRRAGSRPVRATMEADADPAMPPAGPAPSSRAGSRRPLALLAVAIAAYVAAEIGVSNWVVRFLARADLDTATLALSGFWAGLAVGRLAAARVGDRLPHGPFAAGASVIAAVAVIAAVISPSVELAIPAFAVAGFAMGPVFPMIIAIGGDLYPDRLAATAGTLTGTAVLGGTIYPPVVGLMSASLGIGAGMLGAAALSLSCGLLILGAGRATRRARPASARA